MNRPEHRSQFDVFISYARSVSTPLAIDLQRELERFAKRWNQIRAVRVFRDDSSMSANAGLWSTIESALTSAEWFVLIATPESAASEYVGHEAKWWLEHKGVESIMLVLADGQLTWNSADGGFTADSALPPVLRRAFAEEPRWVDMTWFGKPGSTGSADPRFVERVADLAAPVRGMDRDALIGANLEEHRKTMRRARIAIVTLATLLVAAIVAGGLAVAQRNTAKRLFADAVGQRLASEAGRILDGQLPGGIGRGLQELLVAQRLKVAPDQGANLNAMFVATEIQKVTTVAPKTIAVSANASLIATRDAAHPRDIQTWDADLKPVGTPIQTAVDVSVIAFSHDGSLLAAGGMNGEVELWDMPSRTRRGSIEDEGTLGPEQAFVTNVMFTPDDKGLVVRTGDNAVRFYGVESLRPTAAEIPKTAWIAWPRTGTVVAVAPLHGSAVEIRNPVTGALVGEPLPLPEKSNGDDTFRPKLSFSDCRSFDENGGRLMINSEIYDLTTREVAAKTTGFTRCADHNASLSPDGGFVVEGGDTIRVTELMASEDSRELQYSAVLQATGGPFNLVGWLDRSHLLALGPGGMQTLAFDSRKLRSTSKVAFGATKGDVAVQSIVSGTMKVIGFRGDTSLTPLSGTLTGARDDFYFTLNSRAPGEWDQWSFADGSRQGGWPLLLDGDTDVYNLIADQDLHSIVVYTGRRLPSGLPASNGGTLRRWDLATGQQIGTALRVPANLQIVDLLDVNDATVTAFTNEASVADDPGSVWSFDLNSGQSASRHKFVEPVTATAMCRNSAGDVTWMIAEKSGEVGFASELLADGISWSHPPTMGHKGLSWGNVSVTDDCRAAMSWAETGSLQFWDVASGTPFGNPIEGAKLIGQSNDGKELAVGFGGSNGIAGFRTMPARPTAEELCAKLTANMSRKQWNEWVSPDIAYQKACPDLPILPDD